jgi:hypothetical protein
VVVVVVMMIIMMMMITELDYGRRAGTVFLSIHICGVEDKGLYEKCTPRLNAINSCSFRF